MPTVVPVLWAGGVTRLAARALAGPGSASLHNIINIIYTALIQLPRAGSWAMLGAGCKSRPSHPPTAGFGCREAELSRALLWGWGHSSPRQEALGGPGRGKMRVRPSVRASVRHILRGPSGASITRSRLQHVAAFTRSRRAGSSCPAPLAPFVFFCLLLLETEPLMEKACSGNGRFLPSLPGSGPRCWLGEGWRGRCERRARTDPGPRESLCAGQSQVPVGQTGTEPRCPPGWDHWGTTWSSHPAWPCSLHPPVLAL